MLYAQTAAKRAVEGKTLDTCDIQREEANNMRIVIKDLILVEKHIAQKKVKYENPIEKINENESRKGEIYKSDRVCRFWSKGNCKKGNECWYRHPALCVSYVRSGECVSRNSFKTMSRLPPGLM